MLFSTSNKKLSFNTASFSIPATEEVCKTLCRGCYAVRMQRFKTTRNAWERNYKISQSPNFVKIATAELIILFHKGITVIRIHVSGEFYSQEYVNKWAQIASKFPQGTFYGFTKNPHKLDLSPLKKLKNVIIHEQTDNYESLERFKSQHLHYKVCPMPPDNGCGSLCKWCMKKEFEDTPIFFPKH